MNGRYKIKDASRKLDLSLEFKGGAHLEMWLWESSAYGFTSKPQNQMRSPGEGCRGRKNAPLFISRGGEEANTGDRENMARGGGGEPRKSCGCEVRLAQV